MDNDNNRNSQMKNERYDPKADRRRDDSNEGSEEQTGDVAGYSRDFNVDYHSRDEWHSEERDEPETEWQHGPSFNGESQEKAENKEERRIPAFLKRLTQRGDTSSGEEDMTREAKQKIRHQIGGANLFDEEKDRQLAEESTRNVPVGLLRTEKDAINPAARRFEEADIEAARSDIVGDQPVRAERVQPIRESITERERRGQKLKTRTIVLLVVAAIALILFFAAPAIQSAIFKTEGDSLVFNPASGIFGPRAAVIEIILGILGGALLVFSLKKPRRKAEAAKGKAPHARNRNLLRNSGLIMLLFIPLGISSFFNFAEFRNNDIRFSTIFNSNRSSVYEAVTTQDIASQGEEVFYTIETQDRRRSTINVTGLNPDTIQLLDAKFPVDREVRFTSTAIDRLVDLGVYTRDEAIRVFITK